MLLLRSLLFQILFYLNFLLFALLTPIMLFMPKAFAWYYVVTWMRSVMFLWKWITGSTYEYRGLENIPKEGCILASKHQSAWETIGLGPAVHNIVYIMKRELMSIPVFGWFAQKTGMIPVRRSDRSKALGPMIEAADVAVKNGRQIVIFMEGTRMAAGTMRPYKAGVARMADAIQCPIVPVALNTGLFWPRNSFWRYSGHAIIEFLPPILPGGTVQDVLEKLEHDVEEATNALILETAQSNNPPETIHKALDELEARGVDISPLR